MAPERKPTSPSVFTVRLGIVPVFLAAVITFVGLAWIFFLGVMVGRMYYGNTDAISTQTPPAVQQYSSAQAEQKNTGTTYHPVIKEDKSVESVYQGQETVGDTAENSDTDALSPERDATNRDVMSFDGEQNTDFIEKVKDTTSLQKASTQASTTPKDVIREPKQESDVIEAPNTSSASTDLPALTALSALIDTQSLEQTNDEYQDAHGTSLGENTSSESNLVIKAMSGATVDSKKTDAQDITPSDDMVNTYRYQLASFKNADNANAIAEKLVADGLNASVFQEDNNGNILYYILVYHTGTEDSRKTIEDTFIQHQFPNFLMRRVGVQ